MAFSIEARVPFLDNNLTAYVMGLPSNIKVRGNNKNRLLKKSIRGIVPDYVLDGPKTGFGVPYSHWLATSLVEYTRGVFEEATQRRDSLFNKQLLMQLFEQHCRSPKPQSGFVLWKALNLAIWQQKYFR